MSTNTYVALKTYTIPSTQATYTFDLTGITGYTDLFIEVAGRTTYSAEVNYWMQFNNDGGTGSLYSTTRLQGNGSSPASNRTANAGVGYIGYVPGANDASGVYSASSIHIMNYSNSTTYKTSICRSSLPEYAAAFVSLWRNTNAIQYITLGCDAGSWAAGSTFTIYGIANADVGAYATGGIITQDANYYYHAFGSSSTFTPTRNLTADILVVAGGGAAGPVGRGGGGAGGVIYQAGKSLSSGTSYTCTIGAGGAASNTIGTSANGSDSLFSTLQAFGGGGGGYSNGGSGNAGGSGGGAGGAAGGSFSGTGGSSTQTSNNGGTGYGTAGGNVATVSSHSGNSGGGGGAGSAGGSTNSTDSVLGSGGDGLSTWSSWGVATGLGQNVSGTYYFAGGGAGGTQYSGGAQALGGKGGGGNAALGGSASAGSSGMPNTGGGGGAGDSGGVGYVGGSGGSGLIIVRYSK